MMISEIESGRNVQKSFDLGDAVVKVNVQQLNTMEIGCKLSIGTDFSNSLCYSESSRDEAQQH